MINKYFAGGYKMSNETKKKDNNMLYIAVFTAVLKSEKFEEIYRWLIDAAEKEGMKLRKIPNDQLDSILPANPQETDWASRPDFVLLWDKDVKLARLLEREGFKVFNSAEGIETR